MPSASLSVLYFGAARERAGVDREDVSLELPATVGAVLDELIARHPRLGAIRKQLRVAVDQEFVGLDHRIEKAAELALIPPVAGGAGEGLFKVVDRPLSLDEVVRAVSGPGLGGVVTFSGAVRDQTGGRRVVRLVYEAYAPMAEKKLAEIAGEALEKWPGVRLAIVHRVGTLLPGELAVVIATAAPHRAAAFDACRHAIERLKQDVPIWKKEHFEDGEVWVGLGP